MLYSYRRQRERKIPKTRKAKNMKNINEIAETIKNAQTWADVEAEIKALCEAADMLEEYEAADGESFESVIYKAAEILGVEI